MDDDNRDQPVLIRSDFIRIVDEKRVHCSLCDVTINACRISKHRESKIHARLESNLLEARLRLWVAKQLTK